MRPLTALWRAWEWMPVLAIASVLIYALVAGRPLGGTTCVALIVAALFHTGLLVLVRLNRRRHEFLKAYPGYRPRKFNG